MNFTSQTAIVTGASRGIGFATARYFYENGANVTLAVRSPEKLELDKGMLSSSRVHVTKVNVNVYKDLQRMVTETVGKFRKIDILVNNAGVDQPKLLDDIDEAHWNYVMDTNVKSVIFCTQLVAREMKKQKKGKIIMLSSIAGKEGFPAHSAYVASKHAVIGITKCLALELIPDNIYVNAVCPGLINTDMLQNFFKEYAQVIGADPKSELQKMIAKTPLGRMGKPEDVAQLIGFLASEASDNIIGHTFNTDGGILQH